MTKKEIENRLIDFFSNKMESGEAPEITDVKRFGEYLCTEDNGVVIDCTNGAQIRLTIQLS